MSRQERNRNLFRSLALLGILLVPWSVRAQTPQDLPASPAPRPNWQHGGSIQPPAGCVLGNDFESGTVEGWGATNVNNFSVLHPGSSSNSCLYAHDGSGGSTLDAPASYLGDWSKKLLAAGCSCGEFCFDVNLLNDGVTGQPSFWPSFVLYGPGGTFASFQAVNLPKITDPFPPGPHSGWHRVCAPIRLTGGPPPAGADGVWTLHPSTASWDSIVQNVTKLTVPVDWSNPRQTEEVAYDNFCLHCVGPLPFTVNGPLYASSGSAIYCASPVQTSPPVTYTWSVPSPATVTPVAGNPSCATVSWNGLNGGIVTATATTGGHLRCSLAEHLTVKPTSDWTKECCSATNLGVTGETFQPLSQPAGAYQLQAHLTAGPGSFTQVTAEILSTSVTYPAGSTCGQNGPAESHVLSALNLGPMAATIPVAGGHEVWWQGSATLASTPMSLSLQLPPFGGACPLEKVTVCMKYTFTSKTCRTCNVIECYDVLPPVCEGCQ